MKRSPAGQKIRQNIDTIIAEWQSGESVKSIAARYGSCFRTVQLAIIDVIGKNKYRVTRLRMLKRSNQKRFGRPDVEQHAGEIIRKIQDGSPISAFMAQYNCSHNGLRQIIIRRVGREAYDKMMRTNRRRPRHIKTGRDLSGQIDTIIAEYKAGSQVTDLVKKYRVNSCTLRCAIISRIGEGEWQRLKKAAYHRTQRRLKSERKKKPPLNINAAKAALAEIRQPNRIFYMCTGCGVTFDSDPPAQCPKCFGGSFEKCDIPQKLAV